jgi:hypothetical protein
MFPGRFRRISAACTVLERETSAVDPVGDEPQKTRITRNEDNGLRAGSPLGTAAIWATPSDFRVIRVFRGYISGTISKEIGGMQCSARLKASIRTETNHEKHESHEMKATG